MAKRVRANKKTLDPFTRDRGSFFMEGLYLEHEFKL